MTFKNGILRIFIVLLFIVTACSTNDVQEHLSNVNDARNKTTQLENGRFSYTYVVENENEENTTQITNGIFVVNGDYIDWQTDLVLGEGEDVTLTAIIQKDRKQYQRFGLINEDYQFIDNENKPLTEELEWQIVNDDAAGYPDYLESLMNLELNEKQIEKVEKIEESDGMSYTIIYNDSFLSTLKQNNISIINEQLDKAKEADAGPHVISTFETALSNFENITYKNFKLDLKIDKSGVLFEKELQSSYEQLINDVPQNIKIMEKVEIMEYNQADMKIEL
ncbi:hypothetical protein [Bacillus nitroreducens]